MMAQPADHALFADVNLVDWRASTPVTTLHSPDNRFGELEQLNRKSCSEIISILEWFLLLLLLGGVTMKKSAISRLNRVAALLCAMAAAGCTHLETRPSYEVPSVRPGASPSEGAQRGLSYALPMLQYDLKVTYRLSKCTGDQGPEFSITAEATNRYVAGERFEVDYEALTSVMKTTNFAVTFYEAGTLHTLNASARDRTGPILADVARIGVAVASIAAGIPPVGLSPTPTGAESAAQQPQRLTCTAKAAGDVTERDRAANEVKRLTQLVEQDTETLTRLATLATADGAPPEDRQPYRDAVTCLLEHQRQLRVEQAAVATADRALSVTISRSWPNQAGGIQATAGTIELEGENLAKLAGLLTPTASDVDCIGHGTMTAQNCLTRLTRLNIALEPVVAQQFRTVAANDSQRDDVIGPADRRWARGIFVREPTQARLVICRAVEQLAPGVNCGTKTIHRGDLLTAPQFGRLRLLPFTNGPFEEGELKLSLRADGMIDSFSYGEESAVAGAASNLATAAERIDAGLERIETERRSDIQYARDTRTYQRNEAAAARTEAAAVRADELAQVTQERDLLIRQREIVLAQAGLTTAEIEAVTAPINAQLAQLNARIALLRATNDLTALQAAQAGN
jgi:hypothetical protein